MQIISVYADSLNSGRKTLAMALGQQAAKRDNRTLLIELDYHNNGIAQTYGISHSEKNAEGYFANLFLHSNYSIGNYVLNKNNIEAASKDMAKAHAAINSDLDFLVFSKDYKPSLFPQINDFSTEKINHMCKRFFEELRESKYDLVILLLPTDYEDMFAVPMMLESDHTIHISVFSLSAIENVKRISGIFDNETLNKMKYVLNFATKKIDRSDYEHLMRPLNTVQLISYDDQRMLNEVNAEIGSPVIDNAAVNMLQLCDIDVSEQKRSFFSRR